MDAVASRRPASPLAEAVTRVGDRWTLLIVEALLTGPLRFSELTEHVCGIAPNILTQRLRHLERERLVVAQPYTNRPPRFAYALTARGQELAGALRLLADWGSQHTAGEEAPHHAACGSPLETRLYCPTCEVAVGEDEATDSYFV